MNNFLTGCPADCDSDLLLTAIPVEQDCPNYERTLSQISDLVIQPDGATTPFSSWSTTPANVSGAIDNTDETNAKCKWVVGKGGIAAPDKTNTPYPKLKTKTTKRRYRLEFQVFQLTADQYDFCRLLQCGWTSFTFWYADLGAWIYGSATGIAPVFCDCDFSKGNGDSDVNTATIIIEWEADGDPERRVSPLA